MPVAESLSPLSPPIGAPTQPRLSHLRLLEAESIHIFREVASEFERPVMLYSIGKDSSVMLRLAQKAFYPAPIPFPLLHIDTGFKFAEMLTFRDTMARSIGTELLVWRNEAAIAAGTNPIALDTKRCCGLLKTQALLDALKHYNFEAAFGGARRDEEKSRAKERVFSVRSAEHRWDPKNQRPEPWHLFNTRKRPGETFRVFPLSNWTEADVWDYIAQEDIPVVPLYFAKPRPIVERDGMLIMRDDDRMSLRPGETVDMRSVRFRTLGCYPLTGAVESSASTLAEIIAEMRGSRSSEREGRVIDHDGSASMEQKKQEGYF